MEKKGQSGAIIIVVIIIIIGVFFLYKGGYLNFKSNTTTAAAHNNINPYLPISFNVSAVTSLSHLYTGESINFISNIFNSGKNYLTVTLSPYGCSFLPVESKSFFVPPHSPSSSTWTFSSSSPTSCSITFSACFNAVSYTNYPLTIENYNFSGSVPISSITSSSGLPISIGLQLSNSTITAGPTPSNQSEYVEGSSLTSVGSTSKLNWVYISIKNGKGYFTSSTGSIYAINPSINISSSEYSLNFQYGRLLAPIPFSLVVKPISNSIGYSSDTSINVSAGYTYCLTSNSIPLTISSS